MKKQSHDYLENMRTNYFSIFFIYSNPFSPIKDSKYPHFKHTDALTCEKFRNIGPAESGLKTTDGTPPVLIIFPLLIRLLPHFGHFFIIIIINIRQQKFCFNIFGDKKSSNCLENYSYLSVNPIIIAPNQVIKNPTKNLILASGTTTRIINPIIISIIPIVPVINFLFIQFTPKRNNFTKYFFVINFFGGFSNWF